MDYQSNSKASKGDGPKRSKPEKPKVEPVVTGQVLVKKKGIGTKFKEVFIATDLKSVGRYIVFDICVPAFQNLLVDSVSKGVARMVQPNRMHPPGTYGRTFYQNYQTPVQRTSYSMVDNMDRTGLPPTSRVPQLASRQNLELDVVLSTREDAADVLYSMGEIVDQYGVVSLGDFKALMRVPSTHVDEDWGWNDLSTAQVRQIPQGFLIDLPQPQPIT